MHRWPMQLQFIAIVGVVSGVAGLYLLLATGAVGMPTAFESESGLLASPAVQVANGTASGGSAVKFGAGSGSIATLPSQVLDLTNWKITLPIDGKGGTTIGGASCTPIEVKQPALASYSIDPWFKVNAAGDGVAFRANIEGCTTSSSGYPRSELREMTSGGTANASWSTTSGTHTMELTEAVTHLPVVKPETVFAQIHDAADDVFIAKATAQPDGTARLAIDHNGTVWGSVLDGAYVLGTRFTLKVVAGGGYIDIYYNGVQKVHQALSATGCYFKAGNYTQSNIVKGMDAPGAYGEVVLYSVKLTHN